MNRNLLPIHFSPLQGYTDAAYRQAHAHVFGGVETYYTPFVRMEHGTLRRKDARDVARQANNGIHVIPQFIATPDTDKAEQMAAHLVQEGYTEIDINLGCPFPMLAKRRHGAGLLPYPAEVETLLKTVTDKYPSVRFSVKLRLGWERPDECLALLPVINGLPLSHVILHPRLGKQQYKGDVDLEAFEAFYNGCQKPLFYNGDVRTLGDIERISAHYPRLSGIVIGRGLLANPALALEYRQGTPLTPDELKAKVRVLHSMLYQAYSEQLQGGEAQLLTKMKTFWEYLLPDGNRKAHKTIQKTSKLANYLGAVSNLLA